MHAAGEIQNDKIITGEIQQIRPGIPYRGGFFYTMKKLFLLLTGAALLSFALSPGTDKKQLNELLDNWHASAASADFKTYFGATTDDFVFLGTDPSERWTREQFMEFCRPYFEKGTAWDFKPKERNWIFSAGVDVAWFDEKLDTWMEECRGSGVVVKQDGKWKLAYYNLTVLIENTKVKEFIELKRKPQTDE